MKTKQEEFWSGDFGAVYTDRNSRSLDEWNSFYKDTWGITKIEMNDKQKKYTSVFPLVMLPLNLLYFY